MTVTRKDLNAIANTFNQQILMYLDASDNTSRFMRAQAVFYTALEMYETMVRLNPNVQYSKWEDAILANTSKDNIFNRRAMTDLECEELAMSLYDSGADSETVTMSVLTLDADNPCTDADWQVVLEHLGCIETVEG
jgi:hypothetical protein